MTDKEYGMTFGQWCNATKGTNLKLAETGGICYNDKNRDLAIALFHELWEAERKAYNLKNKTSKIFGALESIKAEGIDCFLASFQNGHIKATTRHGVIVSYYATTGTIAGYGGTTVEGLEEFIRICKS